MHSARTIYNDVWEKIRQSPLEFESSEDGNRPTLENESILSLNVDIWNRTGGCSPQAGLIYNLPNVRLIRPGYRNMEHVRYLAALCLLLLVANAHVPDSWIRGEKSGNVLVSKFQGDQLPPFVGNGYLAVTIDSDTIFVGGVYNGPAGTTKPSHRARIPNHMRAALGPSKWSPSAAALDIEKAVFERVWTSSDFPNLQVLEQLYAHRQRRGLLVSTFQFPASSSSYNISWQSNPGPLSSDISFSDAQDAVICGETLVTEAAGATPIKVCYATFLESGSLIVDKKSILTRFMYISTSLDSSDPVADAAKGLASALSAQSTQLLADHQAAWAQLWEHGIEIDGSLQLAQIVNSSLYYILSSSRDDFPWSLSPGSLSSNSYNGHVFWDTETWMLPTISVLYRDVASSILLYRNLRLAGAKQKAASNGYKGLQFPWESAQLGVEVTPTDADTGIYEQHISADIVLAVKQLWRLTGDLQWLNKYSALVYGVADFWASRVTPRSDGSVGVYGVTGPDEYAVNVNNSVYTNVAAKLALEFANDVCRLLNDNCPNMNLWRQVASAMYIPFDASLGIHPEYDGYQGSKIKQADVVLLSYPLGLEMNDSVRLNDVKYYAPRTDVNGPCMTDGIHTIALLSLGLPNTAAEYWPKSFANAKEPFWVWQETPSGGAVNFITGAGGFLQAVVFGYGGLRVNEKDLDFSPQLPPGVKSMRMRGIRYQQSVFDVSWDGSVVKIFNLPSSVAIFASSDSNNSSLISPGQLYSLPNSRFSISCTRGALQL